MRRAWPLAGAQTILFPTPGMKLHLGHGVSLKQSLQTLGESPRVCRKVIRKFDTWVTYFSFGLVGLAEPLPQRINSHMQIIGYVQHAVRCACRRPELKSALVLGIQWSDGILLCMALLCGCPARKWRRHLV